MSVFGIDFDLGRIFDAFTNPVIALATGGAVSGPIGAATTLGQIAAPRPNSPDVPAPPALEPAAPMPTPNDAAVRNARRRAVAVQRQRRGRASTILTTPFTSDDTLG